MKADIPITDAELINALLDRATEKEAIMLLYRQFFDYLSLFVMTNNGTKEDAQDIFQEVVLSFVHIVRQGKFRGESSVKTFLYVLNRNTWFNELKRRDRAVERERKYDAVTGDTDLGTEATIEQREASQQLIKIMDRLGENCKKILLLFYYENLTMKEIVGRLHYENEQVVRNKKYKCMKQLEALIHEDPNLLKQLKTLLHA
ncbi:MAG TPA: sigma-70 family RNA polymerase sigma factor [Flavisolibacter sp.]|nr:sigma-70 family RNA polymerase sigma factor [Flavisolibacter sp.]